MKPSKNIFASLRHDGIRGNVIASDFESVLIYDRAALSLTIHTGKIDDKSWDYGFTLSTGDRREFKAPGEGSGWFASKNDALLFALGLLRMRFDSDSDEIAMFIDRKISDLSHKSIWDD